MKKQINDLLLKMQTGENCIGETAKHLFDLFGFGSSLPSKKEIIFDDSLKAEIETTDKNIKVLRAVNGWGEAVNVAKIQIVDK